MDATAVILEAPGRLAVRPLALTLGTGALLYTARPFEYAGNAAMQAKLLVVALALANALAFEWAARRDAPTSRPGHPYARAAGLVSLLLWPLALVLGRWVAFTGAQVPPRARGTQP